ncbi:MAG: SRPBCC family protein [Dehalococcoidales bacterium]|nr:SRPBCC family protein [Dehalococcoidales bacterium]
MKLKYELDIHCPPEQVWRWLGNLEKQSMWQANVSKTELLKKTPDWIGTVFRKTVAGEGKDIERRGIVTDYEENRLLGMRLSGGNNKVDVKWVIEKSGEHTRLTVYSRVRFKLLFGLLSILFRPIFRNSLTGQMERDLSKLKEICEGGARKTG